MNTITWAPPGPEGPQNLALNAGEQGARSSNATVVSCPHCTTFSRVFYGTRSAMYQWPSRRLLSDRITYTCLPREGFNKEEARLNYVHVLEFKSHCRLEHPEIEFKPDYSFVTDNRPVPKFKWTTHQATQGHSTATHNTAQPSSNGLKLKRHYARKPLRPSLVSTAPPEHHPLAPPQATTPHPCEEAHAALAGERSPQAQVQPTEAQPCEDADAALASEAMWEGTESQQCEVRARPGNAVMQPHQGMQTEQQGQGMGHVSYDGVRGDWLGGTWYVSEARGVSGVFLLGLNMQPVEPPADNEQRKKKAKALSRLLQRVGLLGDCEGEVRELRSAWLWDRDEWEPTSMRQDTLDRVSFDNIDVTLTSLILSAEAEALIGREWRALQTAWRAAERRYASVLADVQQGRHVGSQANCYEIANLRMLVGSLNAYVTVCAEESGSASAAGEGHKEQPVVTYCPLMSAPPTSDNPTLALPAATATRTVPTGVPCVERPTSAVQGIPTVPPRAPAVQADTAAQRALGPCVDFRTLPVQGIPPEQPTAPATRAMSTQEPTKPPQHSKPSQQATDRAGLRPVGLKRVVKAKVPVADGAAAAAVITGSGGVSATAQSLLKTLQPILQLLQTAQTILANPEQARNSTPVVCPWCGPRNPYTKWFYGRRLDEQGQVVPLTCLHLPNDRDSMSEEQAAENYSRMLSFKSHMANKHPRVLYKPDFFGFTRGGKTVRTRATQGQGQDAIMTQGAEPTNDTQGTKRPRLMDLADACSQAATTQPDEQQANKRGRFDDLIAACAVASGVTTVPLPVETVSPRACRDSPVKLPHVPLTREQEEDALMLALGIGPEE